MTTYFVDDGGSSTAPYDTWAKAATSLSALDDAVSFASGDIVYIGHDHVCQYTHAANRTITGPTSGLPTVIISATTGSDPPTYQKSSTDQIDTSEGAYSLTFDGSFALYGVRVKSGTAITIVPDGNEFGALVDCTLAPSADQTISLGSVNGRVVAVNVTIDLTADGTTPRSTAVFKTIGPADIEIIGLTFINAGYRTGTIFENANNDAIVSVAGADFSGFTSSTLCEVFLPTAYGKWTFSNCKTAATWSPMNNNVNSHQWLEFYNCGPEAAQTYLFLSTLPGTARSSTSIYRTGGATFGTSDTPASWLITTTASCSESSPFYTPWMYGVIETAGSRTFDLYVTNDTADFTDAEVWLEIEYHATAGDPRWTLASDQRATITTTAAAQDDDTTSTWTGSGPAYTYKQRLRVTATVGEEGLYRARVAVGVASIASSRYFYVDPRVSVS